MKPEAKPMPALTIMKPLGPTTPISFRATHELRQEIASHMRKGVPGHLGYFATAGDFVRAAVVEKLQRMSAEQNS
ncbi:hypothetical protein DXM27_16605 [Rhizobium rhizogenes]|uniref:Uncharacterized protein n=1 Tax=Rhizobium rhizogenes TaxID=359 RepID=A0AA88EZD6_RHIRH|nr:hypothetical protein [Rhizobium rhizogenes]KAA3500824.1 hypothetical protein DXM27_16605 [Rhizobium rhizogenes]